MGEAWDGARGVGRAGANGEIESGVEAGSETGLEAAARQVVVEGHPGGRDQAISAEPRARNRTPKILLPNIFILPYFICLS